MLITCHLFRIYLTGFLNGKNAKLFVEELWALLLSAQESETGIPKEMIEMKKDEILKRENRDRRRSSSPKKVRDSHSREKENEEKAPEKKIPPEEAIKKANEIKERNQMKIEASKREKLKEKSLSADRFRGKSKDMDDKRRDKRDRSRDRRSQSRNRHRRSRSRGKLL